MQTSTAIFLLPRTGILGRRRQPADWRHICNLHLTTHRLIETPWHCFGVLGRTLTGAERLLLNQFIRVWDRYNTVDKLLEISWSCAALVASSHHIPRATEIRSNFMYLAACLWSVNFALRATSGYRARQKLEKQLFQHSSIVWTKKQRYQLLQAFSSVNYERPYNEMHCLP